MVRVFQKNHRLSVCATQDTKETCVMKLKTGVNQIHVNMDVAIKDQHHFNVRVMQVTPETFVTQK